MTLIKEYRGYLISVEPQPHGWAASIQAAPAATPLPPRARREVWGPFGSPHAACEEAKWQVDRRSESAAVCYAKR